MFQCEEGDAEGPEFGVEGLGHVYGCFVDFGVVVGYFGAVFFCCLCVLSVLSVCGAQGYV